MRKAKRIIKNPKEKFSKSEKVFLELVAQIIVEVVMSDKNCNNLTGTKLINSETESCKL